MIFNKFDVLVKMFANRHTKFHDEFQELCEKTLINHSMISQDHFDINMLTK